MNPLTVADLMKLEDYAEQRSAFRQRVVAHKAVRRIHLGPHMTLLFEDRLTIQYQVQEMLRIERIFERRAIEEELAAYNPLIPDGSNWKATCLIEYEEPALRQRMLARLRGIENHIGCRVGSGSWRAAHANEDLPRSNAEKTAAVHFLRFELDPAQIDQLRAGTTLHFGVRHPDYQHDIEAPPALRSALVNDLA
jgi:hypothetical protein